MNIPEAVKLHMAMVAFDPYAKSRTPEEIAVLAEQIALTLPTTPLDWALEFVRQVNREGSVATLQGLATAWGAEAKRRVDAVPVPAAPEEIEADPEKWRAWEKARRMALIQGANANQALAYANRQLGAATPKQIESADPQAGKRAKEHVMERLKQWAAQQAEEQAAMLHDEMQTERGDGQ